MDDEDKAQIQALVQELNQIVPRTDAVVLLTQYGGGCDESQITATETGYLRLGIELLKAAVAPPFVDNSGVQIGVDWEYLVSEQSNVNFHMFHLDNSLRPDTPYIVKSRSNWKDRLSLFGSILLTLLLVSALAIGLATMLRWIFR